MSSSQLAQASAAPVRVAPPIATKQPSLRLLRGVPAAGAGRDGPGRCGDDEHEYGDDQAVGQQRADDGAEVAGAADGAEVGADVRADLTGRAHGIQVHHRSHWTRSEVRPSAYAPVMQPIPLAALLPADFDPATCKLHCAVFNGKNYPIDVLANDPDGVAALELVARRQERLQPAVHLLPRAGSP